MLVKGFPVGADNRVRTTLSQNPSTLRFASSNPNLQNCYDARTEILTSLGWVAFPDIVGTEFVATWHEDGSVQFEQPSSVIHRRSSSMIRLVGQAIDACVTPDHRMVSTNRNGGIIWDTAKDWHQSIDGGPKIVDRRVIRGGVRKGGRQLTSNERHDLAIAIMVNAEGCVRPSKVLHYADVRCKSPRKQAQLRDLTLGTHMEPNGRLSARLSIHDSWGEWLDFPSKNIKIGKLIELCASDLTWVCEQAMMWDGDFTKQQVFGQDYCRRQTVDAIEIAAFLSGHSTKRYDIAEKSFCLVNLHRSPTRYASRMWSEELHGDFDVYCVTVSSGAIVTRRNERVLVCGNCPRVPPKNAPNQWARWVKDMFVAPPGHTFVARDFSAIEAVLVGYFAGSPRYIRAAKLGVHAFLASYILGQEASFDWPDDKLRSHFKGIKKEHDETYQLAKRTIHSSNYLATPRHIHDLYPETFPTIASATRLQGMYFELFPEITTWHKELCLRVDASRRRKKEDPDEQVDPWTLGVAYAQNPFGYVHRFYHVLDWQKVESDWVWSLGDDAKRLVAFLPQSTAAAIIKQKARILWEEYPWVGELMRLLIHDEIFFEARDDQAQMVLDISGQVMESFIPELPLDPAWGLGDYLSVGTEAKIARVWSDM